MDGFGKVFDQFRFYFFFSPRTEPKDALMRKPALKSQKIFLPSALAPKK
jgi:hypothetical protein